jgi:type IV pilus assembly protein PilN
MQITLNLATRPYSDIRPAIKRLRIAMAVLAVIAIGLGLGLRAFHQKAEQARATEQQVQSRIDSITQERLASQNLMRQPDNAKFLAQAADLNQIFDEKTFSWTLGMEDLETVLPGGVQVTTLEPVRAKDGHITLRLRVVGPRDKAVDLVQNLERSRYFLLPRIVGESTESTGGPGEKLEPVSASNRVNFDLLADYNSAAPPLQRKAILKAVEEEHKSVERPRPPQKPMAAGPRAAQNGPPPPFQLPPNSNRKPNPGGRQ